MSAWLVVEDTKEKFLRLVNLANVSDVEIDEEDRRLMVCLYYGDESAGRFWLKDLKEVEKLINLLPQAERLGWIYIVDGTVRNWRGKLKILQNAGDGKQ